MVKKRRNMTWNDYNISEKRYLELKYFCQQYEDKKREIANNYGLNHAGSDGTPKGNTTGDPTGSRAMRNIELLKDTELIEQTAIEANADIYQELIKSVTENIPYSLLGVPMCSKDFYGHRRYFYYLLDKKR